MNSPASQMLQPTRSSTATSPHSPTALKQALMRLVYDGTSHGLRIELPPPCAHRMRDLVHRGAQRPVSKITSVKLGRVVQCESALEVDAVQILDAQGSVASFSEQPLRIHYHLDGQARHHVPDLAVLSHQGRLSLFEIKFHSDVDESVQQRTAVLQRALHATGVQYQLLTEHQIRQGDNLQRAIRVLRRARHGTCRVQLTAVLDRLIRLGRTELSTFDWDVPGSAAACSIACLLVQGHASLDASVPLTAHTQVWATQGAAQEALTW